MLRRPIETTAETGQVKSSPNGSEVTLLETASLQFPQFSQEGGSLTGNQWVGGPNPIPFTDHFNELGQKPCGVYRRFGRIRSAFVVG